MIDILIGILGMLFILIGFILDEFYKNWQQDTIRYNLVKVLGAGLLIYYAFTLDSWPFMILNGVWFLIAGFKLIKISMK